MSFDIATMTVTVAFIEMMCGGLLIAAYLYYRDEPAALWWGASHILLATGVGLATAGGITGADWITASGFVVFLTCAAFQWHGSRLLTGARPYLPLLFVGPALIAAVNLLPVGDGLPAARGIAAAVLNLAYFGGAVYVLLRPPGDRLAAYKPLAVLFVANIVALGLAPFGGLGGTEGGLPPLFSIVGFLYVEAAIFVLGTTIFVVAAVRERKEVTNRSAATTDELTGLANRRSFFERGEKLIARNRIEGTPCSVLMIDLDRFKSINDRLGHSTGDEVLRVFARTASNAFRPNDILGRVGGEEFAVILPGSGVEASVAIAERLRKAFEEAAEFVGGTPLHATLSVGVAASAIGASLESLMKDADTALYAAKQNGRNRVERAPDALPPTPTRIARVA
jgi:diguanylate cyclase (GGDEF)-like protein